MKSAFLVLVATLSTVATVSAGTTGVLNGYALNGYDKPVPDTLITLESPTTVLTTVTDKRGFYAFLSLPPGLYTVSAKDHLALAPQARVNSDQTTFLPLYIDFLHCARITAPRIGNDKRSQQFDSLDVAQMEQYPKSVAPPILLPMYYRPHYGMCL